MVIKRQCGLTQDSGEVTTRKNAPCFNNFPNTSNQNACTAQRCTLQSNMIISFRHKGIEAFYTTGSKKGIQPMHAAKLALILPVLDAAESPADIAPSNLGLHSLKGDLAGHWAVWVNANWRVTFRFEGKNVELVDYQDYH